MYREAGEGPVGRKTRRLEFARHVGGDPLAERPRLLFEPVVDRLLMLYPLCNKLVRINRASIEDEKRIRPSAGTKLE